MSTPPQIEPLALLAEQLETAAKLVGGADRLLSMRAEDVTLAQTPKDEVWRDGKVVLSRYRPRVEQPVPVPVLIVYAFINRYDGARILARHPLRRVGDRHIGTRRDQSV